MTTKNQLANTANPFQGSNKKVLIVCSAGVLRSPTATVVLQGEPYNFNCRAAGLYEGVALVPVNELLIEWCDEIVCFEPFHEVKLREMTEKPIKMLGIGDLYSYRDPELIELIKSRYDAVSGENSE